jgi:hypothetical protein
MLPVGRKDVLIVVLSIEWDLLSSQASFDSHSIHAKVLVTNSTQSLHLGPLNFRLNTYCFKAHRAYDMRNVFGFDHRAVNQKPYSAPEIF